MGEENVSTRYRCAVGDETLNGVQEWVRWHDHEDDDEEMENAHGIKII